MTQIEAALIMLDAKPRSIRQQHVAVPLISAMPKVLGLCFREGAAILEKSNPKTTLGCEIVRKPKPSMKRRKIT